MSSRVRWGVAFAFVVLGSCAPPLSAAARRIVVVESTDLLSTCAPLGQVSGTRKKALEDAAALGATHLSWVWIGPAAGLVGTSARGEAYDCTNAGATASAREELADAEEVPDRSQPSPPPSPTPPPPPPPPPPPSPPPVLARSSGSCFFVASGIAVTNHHVISDAASIDVIDATGTHHVATVLRSSKESDLAVLDVLTAGVAPIGLATSTAPTLGLEVFTIGYPYPGLLGADPKFSAGSISGLAGIGDARYLQITVPIQPGSSGGPLATMDGQVVGVVTAKLNAAKVIEETGSIPENVNFAVKSSELAPLLRGLALPPSRPAKGRAEAIARAQAAVCQVVATQRAPEPSVASGRFDQAKLGGELTREQVAAATRAMSSELAACERTHGPLPIPSVRLVVSVEPSGRVGSVDLPRRYERDPVVRCLGRVFKATAFPAARNASTFRYTYKQQAAPGDTMTPR